MRCVECSAKQKGEPEQFKFRCPSCGHQVAASKKRDGLADGAIKTALEAVTGNGTFKILPEHLGYELLRRGVSRADKRKKLLPIGLVLLVGGAFVFPFGGFVLVIVAIVMLLKWGVRKRLIPRDPFASAHRFLTINPSDRVLGEDDTFTPGDAERELADTAEQIVICQHARYARFLLANDVHLTNAMPILGPAPEQESRFPGLWARLRNVGGPLTVYVLHDLTPAGLAFARHVRDAWFPDLDRVSVVDLGLNAGQEDLLGGLERPLSKIAEAGSGAASGKLSPDHGGELLALRPGRAMKSVAHSLALGVPLVVLAGTAAAAGAGRSDSGG